MTAAELPLTPTGKVSKRLLQAGVQAESGMVRQ
jgi:hypothetical protein